MNQIRKVAKHSLMGCMSNRAISRATGVSRPVVARYARPVKKKVKKC
jgi:hypothetical protein